MRKGAEEYASSTVMEVKVIIHVILKKSFLVSFLSSLAYFLVNIFCFPRWMAVIGVTHQMLTLKEWKVTLSSKYNTPCLNEE